MSTQQATAVVATVADRERKDQMDQLARELKRVSGSEKVIARLLTFIGADANLTREATFAAARRSK